jgi:hypothetical protein
MGPRMRILALADLANAQRLQSPSNDNRSLDNENRSRPAGRARKQSVVFHFLCAKTTRLACLASPESRRQGRIPTRAKKNQAGKHFPAETAPRTRGGVRLSATPTFDVSAKKKPQKCVFNQRRKKTETDFTGTPGRGGFGPARPENPPPRVLRESQQKQWMDPAARDSARSSAMPPRFSRPGYSLPAPRP